MQDVRLDLTTAVVERSTPAEIEIAIMCDELERGMYEAALEADADIPSSQPIRSGTFEQWRERHLGGRVLRELSFVALEAGKVVGYAILGRHDDETAEHWMTGVARSARGRGVALALKQAQIAAAKEAGWKSLQDAERSRQRADAPRERKARLRAEIRVAPSGRPAPGRLIRAALLKR